MIILVVAWISAAFVVGLSGWRWVADRRASSPRSRYEEDRAQLATRDGVSSTLVEADLEHLPPLVATYLRRAGVVGKPRVRAVHAVWKASMRPTPTSGWKSGTAEQHDFFVEPARLFSMKLDFFGLPAEAYHRYVDGQATMEVRLASLVGLVDAKGARLTQSETVTLFNDMCMLAPGSLADAAIDWTTIDARSVRGTFHNAGYSVSAVLVFDDAGDLVNFLTCDRFRSADGKHFELLPWSTPLGSYRDYEGFRIPSRGEAIWREASSDFVYARLELQSVHFELGVPRAVTSSGVFDRSGRPRHHDAIAPAPRLVADDHASEGARLAR